MPCPLPLLRSVIVIEVGILIRQSQDVVAIDDQDLWCLLGVLLKVILHGILYQDDVRLFSRSIGGCHLVCLSLSQVL